MAENKGVLVLSDGTVYYGKGFGAPGTRVGELVFSTAMTGYQEALTDASYVGQILLMTYPLVGNYGINEDAFESRRIWAEGFVVREACTHPVHAKSKKSLDEFLQEFGVPGVSGLDTRAIVRKIREAGVMPACISVDEREFDVRGLLEKARALDYSKINFVEAASCRETQVFERGPKRVVLLDCGMKMNIVRELNKRGVTVVSVHYKTKPEKIMELEPDGLFVSNGPGDPALLGDVARTVRSLTGKLPIMGICLGHQIMGIAAGGRTFKLKFGHRSANQPVKDVRTGRVYVTTQNHGYAVDEKSLKESAPDVFLLNCNDGTVEGMRNDELRTLSVQFHPEAHPGPRDTSHFFDEFVAWL
ncbi:MAG: glutamine-hydrolyzing carbamoyl-phosphate synthase small subunit [Candidatus Micrarchaeia archaeon]